MNTFEIKKGEKYNAKIVGMTGTRKIRVNSILVNVVTCEDIETKMNMVAKICDLELI